MPAVTRVLAIDAGGIRGIVPAIVLAEIERRAGRSASELFDVVAGTSTGGIVALGVAMPGEDRRARWTAAEIADIYERNGARIFERAHFNRLRGLVRERYDDTGLRAVLDSYFGDTRLSAATTRVLVTAYEIARREIFLFDSHEAVDDPAHDFLMSEAARATTAAPTYFEPAVLESPTGERHVLIDGGVYAPSPAMWAFAETEPVDSGGDIVLVSLGTGSLTEPLRYEQVRDWGVSHWARPVLGLILDGVGQSTDRQLQQLLGAGRYFRFQFDLDAASHDPDNATEHNITRLKDHAATLIAAADRQLDQLCDRLTDTSSREFRTRRASPDNPDSLPRK
jgi:patatin-like phospholipase/acyl hydrolase